MTIRQKGHNFRNKNPFYKKKFLLIPPSFLSVFLLLHSIHLSFLLGLKHYTHALDILPNQPKKQILFNPSIISAYSFLQSFFSLRSRMLYSDLDLSPQMHSKAKASPCPNETRSSCLSHVSAIQ